MLRHLCGTSESASAAATLKKSKCKLSLPKLNRYQGDREEREKNRRCIYVIQLRNENHMLFSITSWYIFSSLMTNAFFEDAMWLAELYRNVDMSFSAMVHVS